MKKEARKPDELDLRILRELVRNSNRSYRTLAKDLGMSTTAIIDRIRELEGAGRIIGYGARLDYLQLGYEFMALVEINISGKRIIEVEQRIARLPRVAAVWDTTGEFDSLAVVMCKSRSELSATVKRMLSIDGVEKTNTNVVLNVVKRLTEFDGV
ncbi:MAG: Lrp/AsnC family transcriptional regulator [Candidatus ainarchaeum sp.]|nr:Lrp/AsnC family transcriptional regulator [Candidatus ainarchaeum sp.]